MRVLNGPYRRLPEIYARPMPESKSAARSTSANGPGIQFES